MRKTIFTLICSAVLLACGTSNEKSQTSGGSSDAWKADSALCADWRAKMNKIRKSIPVAPVDVKKMGLPGNFKEYEGDTAGFPFVSYSYFNSPMYGKSDLDRMVMSAEPEMNSANGVAEAEIKNVWTPIEEKRYLFIYYPESLGRTGSLNSKENVSGNTSGVVLVYDVIDMKPKAAVSVEAKFDTGLAADSTNSMVLDRKLSDELRARLVNNFVKH
ncbi:MAG: hypothetical protein L6Q81_01150 [Bacteroidia bacterium]|nr:hypothetical protein [Bacteroidia bacterium]